MTTLLTLSVYQISIQNQLPNKSGAIPLIGIYFLFVLIMCFVSLATTIFIVHLHTRANAVPPSPMSPKTRRVICEKLASLLSFRTPMQPPKVDRRSRKDDSVKDRYGESNRGHTDRQTAEDGVPNNPTLTSILDLLETRISIDDESRERSDKEAKMRRDWMLAAAVIDRLCFIALIIIFTGGTLVFLLLFLLS